MIYPPSGRDTQAKGISGRYEKIIRDGGPLPDRKKCDCSAPLEFQYNTVERQKACLKGRSCMHVVSRIMYVLVSRRWTVDQIAELVADSSNIGLAWLRVHENENELERQYDRAVVSYLEVVISSKTKKRRRKKKVVSKNPNFQFEYHDSVFNKMLDLIARNPGIGSLELRRHLTTKKFREGFVHLYLKEARRRGYITFVEGARNKRHHFVRTRPEPQLKPFRARYSDETDDSYWRNYNKHIADCLKLQREYEEFKLFEKSDEKWEAEKDILQAMLSIGTLVSYA